MPADTRSRISESAPADIRLIDILLATKKHPEFFLLDGVHPNNSELISHTAYEALTGSEKGVD